MLRQAIGLAVVLGFLGGLGLAAAAPPPKQPEGEVRQASAVFLEQPLSEAGKAAAKTIVDFAVECDNVTVDVDSVSVPWFGEGKKNKYGSELAVAYIAGNLLSQLDSGVKRNDPYSGLIQVFRVYRQLKAKDASCSIPEVENLLAMHRKGELVSYLAKAEKAANTAAGKGGKKN
jgi:hypothetical protein